MAEKLPRCEHCCRPFHASPYNACRQKHCTRPACVRRRQRQRQRRWYLAKYHADAVFRAKECQRAAAGLARRRAAVAQARAGPPVAPAWPAVWRLDLALVGLVAALTDSGDRDAVQATLASYAARGQRLAGVAGPGP